MNYKMIWRLFALILAIEAVFMLPALGISLYDGTTHVTRGFLITLGILVLLIAVNLAGSIGENRQKKKDKLRMGGRS